MSKHTSTVLSIVLSAVIALMAGNIAHASYIATVLSDSPVAYYQMNETVGITANDSVAAQNGTYFGGVTLGVAGPQSPAFVGMGAGNTGTRYNGSNGEMDTGTAITSLNADYTYEMWVNYTVTGLQYFGGRGSGAGLQYDGIGVNGAQLLFFDGTTATFGTTMSPNAWHDLVYTRDSAGTVGVYVDGVFQFAATSNGSFGSSTRITAGVRPDNAGFSTTDLDELSVYNGALSSSQIAAHYEAALPEPGTLSVIALGTAAGMIRRRSRTSV